MTRIVFTRLAVLAGLVGSGWAVGTAQVRRPDFTLRIDAPAGRTVVTCLRGCSLQGGNDEGNPNAATMSAYEMACRGEGVQRCPATVNGWFALTASPLASAARAEAQTQVRVIGVNGHRVRVRLAGLERTGRSPAVILEAGAGERLETWNSIFESIAAFAPVLAYDRPGLGESAQDGVPPTPAHIAQKLHATLGVLNIKPPYVLVGHSWGGPLIRMFTGLYSDDVAGLVYVDPSDLRTREQDEAYWRGQGIPPEEGAKRRLAARRQMHEAGGESRVIAEAGAGEFREFQALPRQPDVPVTVLVSDRFNPASWPPPRACAPLECHNASTRFRLERLMPLTRDVSHGTLILATGRGHHIHVDDPELVAGEIRRIAGMTIRGRAGAR